MERESYLSIVIAVRNDNYGGDFNQRLFTALSWNTGLLEKYQVNTEIILVNWNPINENPALLSQYAIPENRQYVQYRVIEVPKELHEKYCDEKVRKILPMYEFIAKNVGIERAIGQYVLCTNADVLLSEKIVNTIAKNTLVKDKVYRAIRCDFPSNVISNSEIDIQNNVNSFFLHSGVLSIKSGDEFSKKWRKVFKSNKRRIQFFKLYLPFRIFYNYPFSRIFLMKHLFNASGDFLLMHKSNWLNGNHYPENTKIATHTDSLHLLRCLSNNLQEKVLEGFVYHQEHQRRFDFSKSNKDMDLMFQRLLKSIHLYLTTQQLAPITDEWGIKNNLQQTVI